MSRRPHLLLHRLLRHMLPARIRRLRGDEMEGTFLRLLDAAEDEHGRAGALAAWRREAPDLLRTGLRLRCQRVGASPNAVDPPPRKRASMVDHVRHDLRVIIRSLAADPGWTTAAVLTLALAIGATTAIFSVVDAVLLEPLPYEEPERLLAAGAWDIANERGDVAISVSFPVYDALRRAQEPLEELAAYDQGDMTVLIDGAAERASGAVATASLFRALRVAPEIGGLYGDEYDVENGPAAVLLSHGFWRQRFSANAAVVGETFVVDEEAYEIVGVMPPDFAFPDKEADFWLSMARQTRSPNFFYLRMLGRVREGTGTEQAIDRLRALAVDVPNDHPSRAPEGYSALAVPLHEAVVAHVEQQLLIFMAAVSAVLLIACINVVNLALSRATSRGKEYSIRAALGATRARLVQQLVTESVVVSIAGGAVGIALAGLLTDWLVRLSPVSVPRQEEISIDGGVLIFTCLLTVSVGVVIGLMPALRAASTRLGTGLRAGSHGASAGRAHQRLRSGLIVAQVALAVVLLFSAGLLLQTFAGLLGIDRGYDADEVLTLSTSLPTAAYPDFSSRTALYDRVLERVDGLPEVESSALSTLLPYHGWSRAAVRIDGYTPQDDEQMMAEYLVVTPQFFGTVGIPPLSGRLFTERDDDVVVINQTMARTYWPDGNPLGARVTLGPFGMVTVIGVVNDTRYTRLDAAESPQAYVPYRSGDAMDMMLFIRSAGDPRELIVPIRQIFAATDREIAVADIMTIRERLWHTTANERFRAVLLGTFGATALLLAMVGVYGVIAYNVGQRTRELGIRKALGADSGLILRRVVGGGLGLVALGSLIGAAGCWYVATLLEAYLFGVEARDPWAFAAATLALAAAALAAAWIPGRRAAAVDPLVALRAE